MDVFEGKKTGWEGLWYQPRSFIYVSKVFTFSDLRKFKGKVRLLLRKNKSFAKGTNRPNFQFCLCDSGSEYEAESFTVLRATADRMSDEQYVRLDDAVDVARRLLQGMVYGYSYDDLSVEAVSFMQEHVVTPIDMLNDWIDESEEVEE